MIDSIVELFEMFFEISQISIWHRIVCFSLVVGALGCLSYLLKVGAGM